MGPHPERGYDVLLLSASFDGSFMVGLEIRVQMVCLCLYFLSVSQISRNISSKIN